MARNRHPNTPTFSRGRNRAINQRLRLQNVPLGTPAINIISNIIVNHRRGQQGRPQNGQSGRGSAGPNHRGRNPASYNVHPGHGQGHGHMTPNTARRGVPSPYRTRISQQSYPRASMSRGGNHAGQIPNALNPYSHLSAIYQRPGQGHIAQLTLPVVNGSGLVALMQNSTSSSSNGVASAAKNNSSAGTGSGTSDVFNGLNSQILIVPNGPNSGAIVISADNSITHRDLPGGTFVIPGGVHSSGHTTPRSTNFNSMSTLKPGEDPPEVENGFQ